MSDIDKDGFMGPRISTPEDPSDSARRGNGDGNGPQDNIQSFIGTLKGHQ